MTKTLSRSSGSGRMLTSGPIAIALLAIELVLGGCSVTRSSADGSVVEDWMLRDFFDGDGVTVLGEPRIVQSRLGEVVEFDGVDDAFVLDYNPLVGLSRFTIEVVMSPDGDGPQAQRYLHFGRADEDRVLLETRVTPDRQWYHDSFVQSGDEGVPLIDETRLHPTDEWHHVALVFDEGAFATYLNGVRELEGALEFTPHVDGQTSIGVRLNRVYWYQGEMYRIRISNRVLQPHEFLSVPAGE